MLKKLLILILIPFFICSCSKNNVEEIKFSSWGSITEVQIINDIINNFEKENPEIRVNFMHIPQNYFQKIHLLFASSQAPDVIFINNLYLPVYENKLEDLSNIIDRDNYYPQSLVALSYYNKVLAFPRDISNIVIFYNKNIVGEINPNWNFNDFEKYIKHDYGKDKYAISFERDIFWAKPYILTLGFDEGIEFYKNLEGKYSPAPAEVGSSTQAQMFLEEKLAFYASGRWMYPKISKDSKFEFGIVTFPGTTAADASGWAISKDSKHKNAAIKFVKYLSSKNSIEYMTKSGLIVPARIDASKLLDNSKEKVFLDAIKKSKPQKINKNYRKETDMMNKKIFG